MTLINFPGTKKRRRETKLGIAERIMPKVLGILSNGDIRIHGGLFDRYPKQAIIEREISGIRIGGSFCRHDIAIVYAMRGDAPLIEAWIYADRTNYAGMIFGGEVWLRQIAFKSRAD